MSKPPATHIITVANTVLTIDQAAAVLRKFGVVKVLNAEEAGKLVRAMHERGTMLGIARPSEWTWEVTLASGKRKQKRK